MENQALVSSKKYWSIPNIAKNKKKVAPMKNPNESTKMKNVKSERNLTKEEQYKKATIGLKRIMTQFSLADMYSSNLMIIEQDKESLKSSLSSPSSPILFSSNNNDTKTIVSTVISEYQDYQNINEKNEIQSSNVVDLKLWLSSLSSPIPTNMNHHHQQQKQLSLFNVCDLVKKPLPELPIDEYENQLEKPSTSSFKLSSLNNNQSSNPLYNPLQNHKVNSESMKEKKLHCRVIQITNISSSKEYQYELYTKMNGVTQAMQSGNLKKIEKGISADNPKGQLSFGIDGPFSLTFTLYAKPINMTLKKMKSILSSMSIYQDMKENEDEKVNEIQNENKNQFLINKETNSNFPVVGFTQLLSGNQFETFKGKGLHRYTLTKPIIIDEYNNTNNNDDDIFISKKKKENDQSLDIEIMIAFHLEEENISLYPIIPNPISSPHLISIANPIHSQSLYNICEQGDFLDFYIKDDLLGFNWIRYWVTLEKGSIYLRNLQNINIETIECIPLNDLIQVYHPLERKDKEEEEKKIFHQPENGIILLFNKNDDPLTIQKKKIEDDDKKKGFNNNKYYMYICAENPKKAILWRTVFNIFTPVHCT